MSILCVAFSLMEQYTQNFEKMRIAEIWLKEIHLRLQITHNYIRNKVNGSKRLGHGTLNSNNSVGNKLSTKIFIHQKTKNQEATSQQWLMYVTCTQHKRRRVVAHALLKGLRSRARWPISANWSPCEERWDLSIWHLWHVSEGDVRGLLIRKMPSIGRSRVWTGRFAKLQQVPVFLLPNESLLSPAFGPAWDCHRPAC